MKVIFTIDTEPSIAGHFRNKDHTPLLDAPISGDVDGKSEGLGFLMRLFTEHNFKASFFIETVHTHYFPDQKMGHYVDMLQKAGQDIQLHLHPVWKSFEKGKKFSDMCHMHSKEFLADLMHDGNRLIKKWTGQKAVALRTGNFSAGKTVYDAMALADIDISSNICLSSFRPDNVGDHFMNGIHDIQNVHELPATCFYTKNILGKSVLRPLQIISVGHYEMIHILDQMEQNNHAVAVIVTHPFEFIHKKNDRYDNLKVNNLIQKRARLLCEHLAAHKDRFDVVSFSDINCNDLHNTPHMSYGKHRHSVRRTFENGFNDHIMATF